MDKRDIYEDIARIGQISRRAMGEIIKLQEEQDEELNLSLMTYGALEFISAFLIKKYESDIRAIDALNLTPELSNILQTIIEDFPQDVREHIAYNMQRIEDAQ